MNSSSERGSGSFFAPLLWFICNGPYACVIHFKVIG